MTRRVERIGEQIQQEVGLLLLDGVKDPRIGFVTLTGVDVTPDLALARIFYTVVGGDAERRNAQRGLESSVAFLRRRIGQRLRLRKVPELQFRYDTTEVRGAVIDQLLRQIEEDRAANPVQESEPVAEAAPAEAEDRWSDEGGAESDDDEEWSENTNEDASDDEEGWVESSEDDEEEPSEDEEWEDTDGAGADGEAEGEWQDDDRSDLEDEEWEDDPEKTGKR